MKSISYSLIAAAAAVGMAYGQNTATTTPVGYVSLGNTTGGAAIPANTDVTFSLPLLQAKVYTGLVSAASATTLTMKTDPAWATNVWSGTPANPHMVLVKGGTGSGLTGLITGNTGNVLTFTPLNGNFATVPADATIEIVPAWTLKKLVSAQTLPAGTTILAFDALAAGVNISSSDIYTATPAGWFQTFGGNGNADNAILYPGESFVVRAGATPVPSFVIAGEVPVADHRVVLNKLTPVGTGQDVRFGYIGGVGDTLGNSNLNFNVGDQILIYDNATAGQNKAASQILTYTPAGWYGTFGLNGPQSSYVFDSSKGYVFRFAAGAAPGERVWKDTQTYNAAP